MNKYQWPALNCTGIYPKIVRFFILQSTDISTAQEQAIILKAYLQGFLHKSSKKDQFLLQKESIHFRWVG